MNKISVRRHPLTRAVLLMLALVVVGAVYSLAAPTNVTAAGTDKAQLDQGQKLFAMNCSSCHGLNAEGGSQGPSLIGVGSAAVDFQMETGRMPAAGGGVQVPRKSTTFTTEEIQAISAWVASLGPGPAVPGKDAYDHAGLTEEQIARGGELFRTNCSACHNISGKGGALPNGKYAPPLTGVEPKHIYEALRTGPQQMPVFSKGALKDQDVKEIIGYLKHLEAQPEQGGLTLGGLGPVSEGLWAWIIGIGGLSLVAVWIAAKGARAK